MDALNITLWVLAALFLLAAPRATALKNLTPEMRRALWGAFRPLALCCAGTFFLGLSFMWAG